jgi:hypothetical protein
MTATRGARRRDITNDQVIAAVEEAKRTSPLGWQQAAAAIIGIHAGALASRLNTLVKNGTVTEDILKAPSLNRERPFSIGALPDDDVPVDQLVAHRKRQFEHKRAHEEASKLIPVRVRIQGPVGLLHFGDPHVDDDGTDIAALEDHARLVRRTEGLMACNVGDSQNNWVGRLARLYAEQSTSAKQSWALTEWFLGLCDWLYIIGGNHDLWSGSGDPIKWMARQQDQLYKASECRIALNFPNGLSVRVNARHDHSGSSIWNPSHGPSKALMLGFRDHIAIAGHKHESAHSILKDPISGIAMHAIKVASYKVFDRYAKEKGFRDQSLSPAVMTVINTRLEEGHPDLVKVFWCPHEGAEYLTFLRSRK